MSIAPLVVLALAFAAEPDVNDAPPISVSAEYTRLPLAPGGPSGDGPQVGLDVPVNHAMTIVFEYAQTFRTASLTSGPAHAEDHPLVATFQAGGRFSYRTGKATPWGQGLLALATAENGPKTRLYLQPGVGLDVPLGHFANGSESSRLRVGVDYQLPLIGDDQSRSILGKGWRFHAGVSLPWYWFLCAAYCD